MKSLVTCVAALAAQCLFMGSAIAAPGDVVRSVPTTAPSGASAWKIVYRSTGLRGEPIEVSGIVVAPTGVAPAAGRPVVAWAHPTTGVAEKCAPSARATVFATIPGLSDMLTRGYVVAATDYPGLGTPGPHPYLIGLSEARAVIDSVRAAARLRGALAGRRFAVWGHSQGGHAALFAEQIAARYAPELSLVGVAAIAPPTDLAQLMRDDIRERFGKVLTAYALWSWSELYQTPLSAVVTRPAIPIVNRVAKACAESRLQGYAVAFDTIGLTARFVLGDVYTRQPWTALFSANAPGRERIGAPLLVVQGTADRMVRPDVTRNFVTRLCARAARVQYQRVAGMGHMLASIKTASSTVGWIADRFAGRPAPGNCRAYGGHGKVEAPAR
jgi:pimeloyl-ACP methyl ester carboxylesterase